MPCLWCAKTILYSHFNGYFVLGRSFCVNHSDKVTAPQKQSWTKRERWNFLYPLKMSSHWRQTYQKVNTFVADGYSIYFLHTDSGFSPIHTHSWHCSFTHYHLCSRSHSFVHLVAHCVNWQLHEWKKPTKKKLFFKLWMRLCVWVNFFFQWKHNTQTFTQCRLRETNDLEQLVMTPLITIEQLKRNYGRFFFWFFRFMKLFLSIDHTNWNSCDSNSPVNELHQESPFELCFVVECVKLLPFLF